MRALLVHNPTSGTKGHDKDSILAALKLADYETRYVSTKADNADEALKDGLKKGADIIVAAGGDGTVATVLRAHSDRSIPIALLPLGTANNIARSLGIAGTPQELVETWKTDHASPLDIGCALGSWGSTLFLESFGVGAFADFLRQASKKKKPEGADNLRKGREILQKVIKDAEPIDIEIIIDGKALKGEFLGVEVMNIAFTGPGLPLAAKANAGDGKFDVICFTADKRKDMIAWLDAPQDSVPPVLTRQGAKVLLTWREAPNRIDDEYFENEDKKQHAEIVCEEKSASILIPVKHPAQVAAEPKAAAS
jgi:diacylglycerol kinase family enzyme